MLDKSRVERCVVGFIVSKWSRLAGTKMMMLGREDIYFSLVFDRSTLLLARGEKEAMR